ncbi:MAG TPA: barstar family protein, partial [Giesbergeria sp.]|nr:barstar family protein [Giesbergeria sp.]
MDMPLRTVRNNIVQSIRAFRVQDLQEAAQALGHHFLYANLANAQSKQDVLDLIGQQFMLTTQGGKNFDALYDSMTDPVHKSGPQPGFIVVLEHIPANV